MAKQSLGLTQTQTQKLSPLQLQTIKLVELAAQDLEQRVRQEIESNPVLDDSPESDSPEEGGKEVSLDELQQDDYIPDYKTKVNNWGKDPRPEYNTFSVKESFLQSLMEQLSFRNLDEQDYKIAAFIIGSLDDDGYLRRDFSSLVDDLAFRANIEIEDEKLEQILKIVQSFDPPGVGARNLRECLLLQLKAARQSENVQLATRVMEKYFDEFAGKHYQKIMSSMGLNEEQMKAVLKIITRLNPAPGGQIDDSYADAAEQIMPDFILCDDDKQISFVMPSYNIPEIRVNKKYVEMLQNAKGGTEKERKAAATFVKEKLDSAKWFVEALKQRQNTLSKTMQAIIDFQYDFFASGDECKLKPMILEDIAKVTGFDISTISRVVNSKYIETPYKIYPLKYFFSEGLVNKNGEEISTREIKKVLQQTIDSENKHQPFTDEQLVKVLADKGYNVARRTIAKYRDQLGIPLARLRREL